MLRRLRRRLPAVLVFFASSCSSDALTRPDAGVGVADDLGPGPPSDLAALRPGPRPLGGMVGPTGGTVDRLYFGFSGDTRPSNADDTPNYPTATINNIFQRLADADVQFALDLGDHM